MIKKMDLIDYSSLNGLKDTIIYNHDYIVSTLYYSDPVRQVNAYLNTLNSCNEHVLERKVIELVPNSPYLFEVQTYPLCDTSIAILPFESSISLLYGSNDVSLTRREAYVHHPGLNTSFQIINRHATSQKCIVCTNILKNITGHQQHEQQVSNKVDLSSMRIKGPLNLCEKLRLALTTFLPINVRIYKDKELRNDKEVQLLMQYTPLIKCEQHSLITNAFIALIYDNGEWNLSEYLNYNHVHTKGMVNSYFYCFVVSGTGSLKKLKCDSHPMTLNQEYLIRMTDDSTVSIRSETSMWLFCVHYTVPISFVL